MTWDFCEGNFFGDSSVALTTIFKTMPDVIAHQMASTPGYVYQIDAAKNNYPAHDCIINTDPPYYDNIGYADLSDYFYIWLRRTLEKVWPNLTRRIVTPKLEELVATPSRHGSKANAEAFFMQGMNETFRAIRGGTSELFPTIIYYAFKQSEVATEGVTSAGWATFLQAIVSSGFVVDATWPLRTESAGRLIGRGANALASSVVLVCQKRHADSPIITRSDFLRLLKRELPDAIDAIRKAGVGPVDMQQSVIGPGMGVFSRHAKVLEDDDSAMSVRTALMLINRVWEEIENELDAAFDPETQVALAWYGSYGFDARPSGELIMLTTAKNTSDRALFQSGVFEDRKGKAALTARADLPADWTPASDKHLTVWECVQHTARVLGAADGGATAAARLVAQMGAKSADARKLAYRLFEIATKKGWTAEALVYNELAEMWPKLEDAAAGVGDIAASGPRQASLFE
jgi:putative DNA methylase